ncbi:inositol phosphorylceramide synthase [Phreatobacter aquaticus]|uniref:Inositol phosphorylceramide synthase n=1 Tax=Phreatobacter aquaticus TaxID=2570229 RepID=A0A4D7QJP8_9HYPH|nr:phosphatase PAP2 family protein [Phreatobacter aquaticus]QCK86183.1 inositol phosphorylceramide synthase [Phreatobacter aquaticus]
MASLVGHVKGLWGPWWFVPLVPTLHAGVMAAGGAPKPEYWLIAAIVAVAAYATRWTRDLVVIAAPAILVALAYELLRLITPLLVRPERVWGCELRQIELTLFSVGPDTTLSDFFQVHNAAVFDLYFAIPYAAFLYVIAAYAAVLYFRDRPRMELLLWSFAIVHLIAFAIWMVMPAAPPWYIRMHGCAIDMSALPSAGRLLRVDELLGIGYFRAFYSRTANIFGAMPSLHCAMPILTLLVAWPKATWRTRPIHLVYAASMVVASIYLDHHWLLDGLAGMVAAAIAVTLAGWLLKQRSRTANGPAS